VREFLVGHEARQHADDFSAPRQRRIGNHALYRENGAWRARVRVDYRGGVACRVPNPPYIPAS
jgi:hypothetical protein